MAKNKVVKVKASKENPLVDVPKLYQTKKEMESVLQNVMGLCEKRGEIDLHIGKCIFDLMRSVLVDDKRTPAYKVLGYESMQELCEKCFRFKYRKGYYLANVYAKIKSKKISEGDLKNLGWFKTGVLASLIDKNVITDKNIEVWKKTAMEKSQEEFQAAVSEALEIVKTEKIAHDVPPEIFIYRVGLYKEQWNNWQLALANARKLSKSDKEPHLVDMIALSFNSECANSMDDFLSVICERLERVYGVEIYVKKVSDGKVLYGEKLTKNIAEG